MAYHFCWSFFICTVRVTESVSREGAEREADGESEAGFRPWAVSTEPDTRLKLTQTATWTEVGCLTETLRHPFLLIFLKNQLLVFLDLFYCLLFFCLFFSFCIIYFCSNISLLFLFLGLVCSSFSSSFKCKVRLFIWDFSCFLR